MDRIERFKAVVRFQKPDYVPIMGMHGAPGMARCAVQTQTARRLLETGLPAWVNQSQADWERYWGVEMPIRPDFFPADPAPGIRSITRIEDGHEIIEYETGAVTRQLIDNDRIYNMPEFRVYHVRDRESWEVYKRCVTPGKPWSMDRIREAARPYIRRDRPVSVGVGTTWGGLRSVMGPERACTVLYDDPELAHDIIDWQRWMMRTYRFPMLEAIRPEIVATGEDMCYNHGMFISPAHFEQYCAPAYREITAAAGECGADLVAVDCDGNVGELVPLLAGCGVNGLFPCEAKAGNDLFALREKHPGFVFVGWLEKEIINEGNQEGIRPEIMSKVPRLLESGGYFPNGDHGLQPLLTFPGLCRFMTLLHEVTGNPEGEFPPMKI